MKPKEYDETEEYDGAMEEYQAAQEELERDLLDETMEYFEEEEITIQRRCLDCGKRILDESNRICAVCETEQADLEAEAEGWLDTPAVAPRDLMDQVDVEEEVAE